MNFSSLRLVSALVLSAGLLSSQGCVVPAYQFEVDVDLDGWEVDSALDFTEARMGTAVGSICQEVCTWYLDLDEAELISALEHCAFSWTVPQEEGESEGGALTCSGVVART